MSPPMQELPCPVCGHSRDPIPTSCKICGGSKIVTPASWSRWALRPAEKASSTTFDMRRVINDRVAEVRERGGPLGGALAQAGEDFLAVFDSWKESPADGRERANTYKLANLWLSNTAAFLRGRQ